MFYAYDGVCFLIYLQIGEALRVYYWNGQQISN